MLTFNESKHEYKYNGLIIPSVTQILRGSGLVNLDWIPKELLEEKADLGTKIHKTTELYDQDTLDYEKLHSLLKNYLNGWIKFRETFQFEPLEIEPEYYHKIYRYAGRIDRVGIVKKEITIVDIKSGTHQKTHEIQTAGYQLLYNSNKPKKEQSTKRLLVYLKENDFKVEENKNKTDESVFLSALTIYNYKRGL